MTAKYRSVDHPQFFEFHDSSLKLVFLTEDSISVYADCLNISKDAEQNPKRIDLEIKKAHITFYGVSDVTYEPWHTWKTDEQGNSVPVGPRIIFNGKEALKRISNELENGMEVFSHQIVDGDHFVLSGSGIEPYFDIMFKAERFTVEWNEYAGPAWYELTKQFKKEMIVSTPNGDVKTEVHFITAYDPDELYYADDPDSVLPKAVSVGMKYADKQYWGHGNDRSGQEAFSDLQKQLPDGIVLNYPLS